MLLVLLVLLVGVRPGARLPLRRRVKVRRLRCSLVILPLPVGPSPPRPHDPVRMALTFLPTLGLTTIPQSLFPIPRVPAGPLGTGGRRIMAQKDLTSSPAVTLVTAGAARTIQIPQNPLSNRLH